MSSTFGRQGVLRSQANSSAIIPNPKLKLLDQVREVMRLKHYSLRTERAYSDWVRRFVKFHQLRSREELLTDASQKMELFLSDLAVNGQVAASTQNQAFNALLFLFRELLHHPLENVNAVRANRPVRVPTVLTVEEARLILSVMSGTPQTFHRGDTETQRKRSGPDSESGTRIPGNQWVKIRVKTKERLPVPAAGCRKARNFRHR